MDGDAPQIPIFADLEIVMKKTNVRSKNVDGSSDGMEVAGLRRISPRRLHDSNVRYSITDMDWNLLHEILISRWRYGAYERSILCDICIGLRSTTAVTR
jgi:hypothetical protein